MEGWRWRCSRRQRATGRRGDCGRCRVLRMDHPRQRRLIKQSYELVERLELTRRRIYERVQARGESASTPMLEGLARAKRLLAAEDHARTRHARRMRAAREATAR